MELITTEVQTVNPDNAVLFQTATTSGSSSIWWRIGSGIVTLRGLGPQMRARFRVAYHCNVALSTGAEIEPIELAVRVNGEALGSSRAVSTPAAVGDFNSIGSSTYVDVAAGCCTQVSLGNIGTTDIDVENVSFIVERVA